MWDDFSSLNIYILSLFQACPSYSAAVSNWKASWQRAYWQTTVVMLPSILGAQKVLHASHTLCISYLMPLHIEKHGTNSS